MMNSFFETIKAVDGIIYNLEYHQRRYENVLKHFGVDKIKSLKDHLSPPENGIYRCRLTYDADNIDVEYVKYSKRKIETLKLVHDDSVYYSLKSTNRQKLDELYDKREGCSDVIIIKNSLLTDTSIANIALYDGKDWITPRSPLLKGTTRQRYLDSKKLIQKDIDVKDIYNFKRISLLNAMIDFDIIAKDNLKDIIC